MKNTVQTVDSLSSDCGENDTTYGARATVRLLPGAKLVVDTLLRGRLDHAPKNRVELLKCSVIPLWILHSSGYYLLHVLRELP
jgi:hypothetical protein